MKLARLINIMFMCGFTPYTYNKDETDNYVLEDGISFSQEGENEIEVTFTNTGEVCNVYHEYTVVDKTHNLQLNSEKEINLYLHNYLQVVSHNFLYLSNNLSIFSKILIQIENYKSFLNNKNIYFKLDSDDIFYIEFYNPNLHTNFYAKFNTVTQQFVWCSNNQIVNLSDLWADILFITQTLFPYKYLHDTQYTENTATALSACTYFLKAVQNDRDVNQGIQYGLLISNYFELKDIPDDYQELKNAVLSRDYTPQELRKYGYFDLDIYQQPIYVNSIV